MQTPSSRIWVEEVAYELLDGIVLAVRGLPSTGKTELARAVHESLPDTSVFIDGRSVTEQNQDAVRQQIQAELRQRVEAWRSAQLIIDDYPNALRRSRGAQLQRALVHELVDGPNARYVGALVTGRWSYPMHLQVRGSPLMSRARLRVLPGLDADDLRAVGYVEGEWYPRMFAEIGRLEPLLALVRRVGDVIDFTNVRTSLEQIAPGWVADLPADGLRWFRETMQGRESVEPEGDALEATLVLRAQFVTPPSLLLGLQTENVRGLIGARSRGWPAELSKSVDEFCELLAGVDSACWVDRYLLAAPSRLLEFLGKVRQQTQVALRLLCSSSVVIEELKAEVASATDLCALAGVEIRSITGSFYSQLHDRQLLYLGDRVGGAVLPPLRVILGLDPVGSAVATRAEWLNRELVTRAWEDAVPLDSVLRRL